MFYIANFIFLCVLGFFLPHRLLLLAHVLVLCMDLFLYLLLLRKSVEGMNE